MGDPLDDLERKQKREWEWEQKRPLCRHCGEHICDDECYLIDYEIYCWDCVSTVFGRKTEHFINE